MPNVVGFQKPEFKDKVVRGQVAPDSRDMPQQKSGAAEDPNAPYARQAAEIEAMEKELMTIRMRFRFISLIAVLALLLCLGALIVLTP
jgi:hypothetical protein